MLRAGIFSIHGFAALAWGCSCSKHHSRRGSLSPRKDSFFKIHLSAILKRCSEMATLLILYSRIRVLIRSNQYRTRVAHGCSNASSFSSSSSSVRSTFVSYCRRSFFQVPLYLLQNLANPCEIIKKTIALEPFCCFIN